MRRGIELGFIGGNPIIYDGTEPCAIDAQAGKGKLTRFLGVNLVSPRTAHLTKIITDPKDGELAWVSWKTLERQGYDVRFINAADLYGYRSESFNINTRLIEIARTPALSHLVWEAAYDSASFLVPLDKEPRSRWIGQGVRTMFAAYNAIAARFPSKERPCTVGGLSDFFGREKGEIAEHFRTWGDDARYSDYGSICNQVAGWTSADTQWSAYDTAIVEALQAYLPNSAGRAVTESNSFEPAQMKSHKTALFIVGLAESASSRNLVGTMTAAIVQRFAGAKGDLRALVVGDEWGQLYVSNFFEMLTLYRQGGIDFLGAFQNAAAQIEAKYGREVGRIWKKACAYTVYRGLPDVETLREIEYLSGKSSVMMRGASVSNAQVNGSGDNIGEHARPLLQVEDMRALTSGEHGLLHARDIGFYSVDMPNFWERPEMAGMLRDVRMQPAPHAHLVGKIPASSCSDSDSEIEEILVGLRARK